MWHDIWQNLYRTLSFVGIGSGILLLSYFVRDVVTPGKLGRLGVMVTRDRNINAIVLTASHLFASGIIVAAAVSGAQYQLGAAAVTATVVGIGSILVLTLAEIFVDWCTPGKLSHLLNEEGFHPLIILVGVINVVLGLIIAASLL